MPRYAPTAPESLVTKLQQEIEGQPQLSQEQKDTRKLTAVAELDLLLMHLYTEVQGNFSEELKQENNEFFCNVIQILTMGGSATVVLRLMERDERNKALFDMKYDMRFITEVMTQAYPQYAGDAYLIVPLLMTAAKQQALA